MDGTLGLMQDALAVFNKPKNVTATATNNLVDPATGQPVVPFDQDDTPTVEEDPLAQPAQDTITGDNTPEISNSNLKSNAGVEVFTDKVAELLKSQREEMSELCGGRTDDVARAVTQVIVALVEFKSSVVKKKGTPVVVPSNLSLMEIMFHNGILMDRLEETVRANFHIDDVLCVPAGSVVYL
jgi:hypothetical protein